MTQLWELSRWVCYEEAQQEGEVRLPLESVRSYAIVRPYWSNGNATKILFCASPPAFGTRGLSGLPLAGIALLP